MKLWGGRFTGEADSEFARFNASFRFDRRLIEADIEGSLAQAEALAKAGIISWEEAGHISYALKEISRRASEQADYLDRREAEDVHSFVEAELVSMIGDTGYKLHTGRSRNDQVATDLRLFLRAEIDNIQALALRLQRALIALAEANPDCVIPGYTHMQRAQPLLLAHYFLAYFEMFARDRARLSEIRSRVNRLPLGSGALAGTGFPVDREQIASRLGFEGVCENSLDAVSDRDFVIEFVGAASIIMVHLSRLSEDLIIYSTSEFDFIELSDAVSTGSSLMPQKKNPDSLELIRGKAGRVFGHHTALLAMMKGLPLAYNKDMQEDKEALFDTLDTLSGSLSVMATVLGNIRVKSDRARLAASKGFLNATDLADYLVRRGLEFRHAHEAVGRAVSYAIERDRALEELSLEEFKQFSPLFEQDLYAALSLDASLASKSARGGTSPGRVREALARAMSEVSETET
ncbi:MAG TPA: argininosuccinate lyase [Blastocatellia bacterium]|jgi:argininosuccinate lyase|nr:argininosuccinate lyase [Blastocatellia bacterium]